MILIGSTRTSRNNYFWCFESLGTILLIIKGAMRSWKCAVNSRITILIHLFLWGNNNI